MENLKRNETTAAQAIAIEDCKDHPFRPGEKHSEKYFELLKQRRALPVSSRRQEFLDAYHQHQVIVLSSETGSGKTTQIPQFILFNEWEKPGKIACTQPRRIAATSVAARTAAELDVQVGDEVGYLVRFDRKAHPRKTKLGYMTDGMLTELAKTDPNFNLYACIMIDEAHERTLSTDILLALLKRAASQRSDLKVVVMSATLDAEKFVSYFGSKKTTHFALSGKNHPVQISYLKEPVLAVFNVALMIVKDIHDKERDGDILIFFQSVEEVEEACTLLRKEIADLNVLPLYSQLPESQKDLIFQTSTQRKCMCATNIAEASITIDGIVHVIDLGKSKQSGHNPRMGLETLLTGPISQAAARQRAGRAGRTKPGFCYRLYTHKSFMEEMRPSNQPAILESDMASHILQLKAMGFDDVARFDFIDPPHPEILFNGLQDLIFMGYIDRKGGITDKGRQASKLHAHPVWYNALVEAHKLGCSSEMLTIAALDGSNIYLRPHAVRYFSDLARQQFSNFTSDHLAQLNAFHAYTHARLQTSPNLTEGVRVDMDMREWCFDAFLNQRVLEQVTQIRQQLKEQFFHLFPEWKSPNTTPFIDPSYEINIRKALARTFYYRSAVRDPAGIDSYRIVRANWQAGLHPDSHLVRANHEWIIFGNFTYSGIQYLSNVTAVEPEWLAELDFFKEENWLRKPDGSYRMPILQTTILPLQLKKNRDNTSE
ncbi:P-loop containing nucleoside triphosphate hydrolase protein [Fusarium sp. MPI-SDFR-AT-0072]|nr:P-loop containing nucleoside triphosphate hydrolase protein [Fusarium sp. MPI-SDFR-AT-0072]